MRPHWAVRAHGALWVGCFITLAGMMCGLLRGESEEPDRSDDTRSKLVLLKSGRMLNGQVSLNAGGYLIEQPNGRIQVPEEQVKFIVNDLREAYRKQRDSIVEPTPATHLSLANWCISYNLLDDAREELKRCLKSDPENEEARRLLARLVDTLRSDLPAKKVAPPPKKTMDGFQQRPVESLGLLSRETAMQFTNPIQPLLRNKCGNASCHGANSQNDFHILTARSGSRGARHTSERNLAEVMRFIDIDNIGQSKLLTVFKGAHGGRGSLLTGQAANEQYKTLRAWVKAVAEEKQAEAAELEEAPSIVKKQRGSKKNRVVQASARVETPREIEPDSEAELISADEADESSDEQDSPRKRSAKPDPNDAAELAREPVDAFDPEEFNRQSGIR